MYSNEPPDPYAPLTEEQKEMAAGDKQVIIGTVIGTLGAVSALILYVTVPSFYFPFSSPILNPHLVLAC